MVWVTKLGITLLFQLGVLCGALIELQTKKSKKGTAKPS